MAPKSLMHRSAFMKRRKILSFIFATMIAMILVGGWGSSPTSGLPTISAKENERIVMWAELPESGTPEDYDLLTNLQFAAQKLYTSSYFRGESIGDVNAKVGPIPYVQHLNNMRIVKGDTVFAQTISTSTFVDSLEQQYSEGNTIFMRKHDSISKNGEIKWKNTAYRMSLEEYNTKYSPIPHELSKYIIGYTTNDDPTRGELGAEIITILSVRDENAQVKSAINAGTAGDDDSEPSDNDEFDINGTGKYELGFDVPKSLVAGDDGLYRFTLVLDPINSTKYYRNEVQTRADANDKPSFISASVTVVIDKDWTPISVTTSESYGLYMMGFNATCSSTITETFTDINKEGADIPEDVKDFFGPYIAEAANGDSQGGDTTDPDKRPTTAVDYLGAAFADYFDGSKNLDLAADIDVDGLVIDDLRVSVNIKTLNIRAKLGKLGIEYADDKVYLTLNDTKGYISKDDFIALTEDERLMSVLTGLGGGLELPDFAAILGDEDLLATVFENHEMTTENGITRIHIPFTLEGIEIDASLYIKDDDMSLQSINGTVKAFGKTIKIDVKPKTTRFATVDGSYKDLSATLDFIADAVNTASSEQYGLKGTVAAFDQTIGVDAYIDRANGLKAEAVLSVLGQDITVKYVSDVVYIELGNIALSGTKDELPELLDAVSLLTGIDFGSLDTVLAAVKRLLPKDAAGWTDVVRSIDADENSMTVELELFASPIELKLKRANGNISTIALTVDVDILGFAFDADADLDVTTPAARTIQLRNDYVKASEITPVLVALKPYVDAQAFDVKLGGSVTTDDGETDIAGKLALDRIARENGESIAVSGKVAMLGQDINIVYVDSAAYLEIGNIRIKCDTTSESLDAIKSVLELYGVNLPDLDETLENVDIENIIDLAVKSVKSLSVDNGTLILELDVNGIPATVTVDPEAGAITVKAEIDGAKISLNIDIATAELHDITAPDKDYIDAIELLPAAEAIKPILDGKAVSTTVTLDRGGKAYSADIVVSFDNGLKLELNEAEYGLNVIVADKAYVTLGDIKLVGELDDIDSLPAALDGLIPESILSALDFSMAFDSTEDIVADILGMIKSLTLENDTLDILLSVNDTAIGITLDTALTRAEIVSAANGTDITVTLGGITAGGVVSEPTGEFVPASTLIELMQYALPLIGKDGYNMSLGMNVLGVDCTGTVNINTKSETLPAQLEVSLMIGDVPVSIILDDGTIYFDLDSSIKISSGTSKAEIMDILDKIDYAAPGIKQKILDLVDMLLNVTPQQIIGMLALSPADNGFTLTIDTADLGFDAVCDVTFDMAGGLKLSVDCDMTGIQFSAEVVAHETDETIDGFTITNAEVYSFAEIYTADGVPVKNVFTTLDMQLDVTGYDRTPIAPRGEYVELSELTDLIAPIVDLIRDGDGVKTITLGINAFALTSDNSQLPIDGTVTIELSPAFALDVDLVLFKGSVDENGEDASEKLNIRYASNKVYIRTGEMMLSFDVENDLAAIAEILKKYLPEYLDDEIDMLLGQKSGASMFSDISLLIARFKQIVDADGIFDMVEMLFSDLGGTNKNSAAKAMTEMVSLRSDDNGITISASMFGMTANLRPIIETVTDDDGNVVKTELRGISVNTSIGALNDLYIEVNATLVSLSDESVMLSEITDKDKYVSIIEFVSAIDAAVSTFTAKTESGDITFAVDSFAFDYDIFELIPELDDDGNQKLDEDGNPVYVKDEAGRNKSATDEDGNKIVANHIAISTPADQSALKGRFVKTPAANGKTSYKINLEAHIILAMNNLTNSSPLALDLYVVGTDDTDGGVAWLNYYEGKSGYGERISIDYNSVLQIVAAIMDIMDVKIVGEDGKPLLSDYHLDIDTTVFDSMAIEGLDDIRTMLNSLVAAVADAKDALGYAKAAIDILNNAGDTETLRDRFDDYEDGDTTKLGIKSNLSKAIDCIKSAIAAFGDEEVTEETETTETTEEPAEPETTDDTTPSIMNGSLYKMIVNSVAFASGYLEVGNKTETPDENGDITEETCKKPYLKATIDNKIATQTSGYSSVQVTRKIETTTTTAEDGTDTESVRELLDSIEVKDLDVNTNRLNKFSMRFTAGSDDITVEVPDGYEVTGNSKVTYSNLANLKHILFDVMNTANLLEFDIGGLNTSDAINIHMKVGSDKLASLDLNVKYNAKVKIIKVGEDENGKAIYKTAAAVEIHNEKAQVSILSIGSKVIVPECTTRLFFYDDVIYIQGIESWDNSTQDRVVGTVTDVTCIAEILWKRETRYPTLKETGYLHETTDNFNYVNVMYTVNELFWMIDNDMNKFLDQFLYYLIPITTEKFAGIDIRGLISSNISGSDSGSKDTSGKTIAQIFKGYEYTNGQHSIKIGLAELASSSSLSDLNILLKGENDGDNNILDSYISYLHIDTSIAGIITVNLGATLRNVGVANDHSDIYSKGLAPMNITREKGKYSLNGVNYVLDCFNYDRNTLYTLDGLTYFTANGDGLYTDNGSFAPALRSTDGSDIYKWTSTFAETRYCNSVYKTGDTGATYYYTALLSGYRYENADTYYVGTNADGSKYVYRLENGAQIRMNVKSITNHFLAEVTKDASGKVIGIENRNGGVQWQRIWKDAYDQAQAAA